VARFAESAKPNNSCFKTTTIIGQYVFPRGLIQGIFDIDSKKFAPAQMLKPLHAPGKINFSCYRHGGA